MCRSTIDPSLTLTWYSIAFCAVNASLAQTQSEYSLGPVSQEQEGVDLSWTSAVQIQYVSPGKGQGLSSGLVHPGAAIATSDKGANSDMSNRRRTERLTVHLS